MLRPLRGALPFALTLALLVPGLSLLRAGQTPAAIAPIALRPEPQALVPREFYIARVIDERKDQKAVAYLLPAIDKPAQPVDLQGGGLAAIRQFVGQSLRRNPALRPVTIRIQECRVTETPVPGTNWLVDGRVAVHLVYEWPRNGRTVRLTSYQGGARYRRTTAQLNAIEPTLRQSLLDGLRNFNAWMNQEAPHNPKLASRLRVVSADFISNTDPDTLFYSPDRSLRWDDFRAQPRDGRYGAAVFPSFSYQAQSRIVEGVLRLDLTVKVFTVRSSSWVSPATRQDPAALEHEQHHFDIVKLVAERFKRKVHPDSLTVDDYNARMQYQFLQSWWEMNRLQEQYDSETQHGQNEAAQQRWNRRVEAELRQYGVKP